MYLIWSFLAALRLLAVKIYISGMLRVSVVLYCLVMVLFGKVVICLFFFAINRVLKTGLSSSRCRYDSYSSFLMSSQVANTI